MKNTDSYFITNNIWERLKHKWTKIAVEPSHTKRTKIIFRLISTLRPRDASSFHSHRKTRHRGEYIVDIAWTEGSPYHIEYHGLLLAMESELSDFNKKSRWRDFTKLADIRSDLKVFLCRFRALEEVKIFPNNASKFLANHRHRNKADRYLLLLGVGSKEKSVLHGHTMNGLGQKRRYLGTSDEQS